MSARMTLLLSAGLLGTVIAAADAQDLRQDRPPAERQPAVDTKACAPGDRLQAGEQNPTAPQATTGESLSDKLARTDGVICPPNIDPGIRAPTPPVGTMPIIPPPGSPGGDPSVRPK